MKIENHGCATCKWAEWQLTKAGKTKRNKPGKCHWPIPPKPPLPLSFTSGAFFRDAVSESSKVAIWIDYTECPVWEAPDDHTH